MLKAITPKVEEKQLKLLEAISGQTHVPKSALIRQGIELMNGRRYWWRRAVKSSHQGTKSQGHT